MFSLAPNTKGNDGAVQKSFIQYGTLDAANKKSFPVELIRIETLSTRTGAHDGDGKSVRSLGRDRRRVPLAEHVKQ